MRVHSLSGFLASAISLVAAPEVAAQTTVLVSTEIQATNSPDTELRPSLGDDLGNGIASLVVYSAFDATNKATVEYQRITDNGPVPGGHMVVSILSNTGERLTDDELNDVSGDLIVYTAFRADGAAQIRSYRISDGTTNFLSSGPNTFLAVGQAKIHGNNVVWLEQVGGVTVVVLADVNNAVPPATISDGISSAAELNIGDTFVVWKQGGDTYAYDLCDGSTVIVANAANSPATSGSFVVWEAGLNIFALDLDLTDPAIQITNDALNINASIDDGIIAWENFSAGNFDIYLHRLAEGDTFQLTSNPSDQQLNNIFNNKVAYLDDRDDIGDGTVDIYVSTFSFVVVPGGVQQEIAAILDFFDMAVVAGMLVGIGNGNSAQNKLNAVRNMLASAEGYIAAELFALACQQLEDVLKKIDGAPNPPDFVTGADVSDLATRIQALRTSLGCT